MAAGCETPQPASSPGQDSAVFISLLGGFRPDEGSMLRGTAMRQRGLIEPARAGCLHPAHRAGTILVAEPSRCTIQPWLQACSRCRKVPRMRGTFSVRPIQGHEGLGAGSFSSSSG
jgi:hypothetical protein